MLLLQEEIRMIKKLRTEKYKGCRIRFTREVHRLVGGYQSTPVIEAVIYGTNNIRLHTIQADYTKDKAFEMVKKWINKRQK